MEISLFYRLSVKFKLILKKMKQDLKIYLSFLERAFFRWYSFRIFHIPNFLLNNLNICRNGFISIYKTTMLHFIFLTLVTYINFYNNPKCHKIGNYYFFFIAEFFKSYIVLWFLSCFCICYMAWSII